jgi:hypothetical protein
MNPRMARRRFRDSNGKEPAPVPLGDEGALSARMRELILGFDAKERRKQKGDDGAGAGGKRRRRGDHTTDAPSRES